MLEGLEVSVLLKSEVEKENEIFRIDSEFQLKEYIDAIELIKTKEYKPFEELIELLTDGKHGGVDLKENGVVFLRTTNIKENNIDLSDLRFISKEESNETLRAEINEDDILLTTIGTIGLCVKVPKGFPRATINQNLVKIVLKNRTLSSITCCFLNSKYGRYQTIRFGAGNVYQMINYPNLRKIIVPTFSNDFVSSINNTFNNAHNNLEQSKTLYTQAEQILLKELNILSAENPSISAKQQTNGSIPVLGSISIKRFKDSYQTSSRLDAEYYQPKYDEFIEIIKANKNGWDKLINICTLNDANFNPKDDTAYEYLELSNIGSSGEITGSTKDIGVNLPTRARRLVKENQLIVSSIEGSLQSCALVTKEYDNALCSTGFYVLSSSIINSETLLVLFKSSIIQSLLKKGCSGTILTGITKEEFSNIPLPLIERETQTQISNLIQQSFQLRQQSKHLLEVAKQAVEIAIEQNEKVAMDFIHSNT